MNYTGITVTENASPAVAINAIKITNGVHDVFSIGTNATMQTGSPAADVKLTSVTVDTTNHVLSGYDADGNRYILDQQVAVSLTLA